MTGPTRQTARALVMACAVVVACLVAPAAGAARLHVVAAGNNIGAPGEVMLRFAEDDATRFAGVLGRLGGARAQDTSVLLGGDAAALRQLLDAADRRVAADPDSVLVVYYSGHADAAGLHLGDTVMPFDELRARVAASPAALRLLVVDSCRSGGLTRVKGVRKGKAFEMALEDTVAASGLAVITSSAAGEDSQESDRLRGSFFSHHLTTGLRGAADRDANGEVTLTEAYHYAYTQTLRSSSRTLALQHPTYEYDIKGRGGVVLTRLSRARRRTASLKMRESGLYVVHEASESGRVVAEVAVSRRGGRVILPPGDYFVQRRGPRAYQEYEVTLAAGERSTLDERPHRTVAYARLLRKGGGERGAVFGLSLMSGVRGEVLPGEGATPQLLLGWTADLPFLTLGVRARWSMGRVTAVDGVARSTHHELSLGVSAERYVDLPWFSLAFGAVAEGVLHLQRFDTPGVASDRTGWGFGLSVLLALERELVGGLGLRIEGGARTEIFERVKTRGGVPAGSEIASPFTGWFAGGLVWRF